MSEINFFCKYLALSDKEKYQDKILIFLKKLTLITLENKI